MLLFSNARHTIILNKMFVINFIISKPFHYVNRQLRRGHYENKKQDPLGVYT